MMLRYSSKKISKVFPGTPYRNMTLLRPFRTILAVLIAFAVLAPVSMHAQFKSLEVSETDGLPVLIKHLPEWEKVKDQATLTNWVADLKQTLGPRPRLAPSGLFLTLYAAFRIAVEFVRVPDADIGYLAFGWLTMGQVLSLPVLAAGLWMLAFAYTRREPSGNHA